MFVARPVTGRVSPDFAVEGDRTSVRWELTPAEGGTLLVLTQRYFSKTAADVLKVGLPYFVIRLEAHLDGRDAPAWETRFEEARRIDLDVAASKSG